MTPERTLHENGVLRHEAVVSRQTVDRLRATLGASKAGAPGPRKFAIGADVADLIGPRGEMGALASRYGGRCVLHVDYAGVDLPAPLEWQVDTVSNQTTR